MADDSGPAGMMGVLIGVLIVVIIGGGLLLMNGNFGNQSGVNIQLPRMALESVTQHFRMNLSDSTEQFESGGLIGPSRP